MRKNKESGNGQMVAVHLKTGPKLAAGRCPIMELNGMATKTTLNSITKRTNQEFQVMARGTMLHSRKIQPLLSVSGIVSSTSKQECPA